MNLGVLYWVGSLIALAIFGGLIWILYLNNKEKEDPENESILINLMPSYSQGYALGTIDKIETSKRITKITFFPRDINYIKMLKQDNKVIKPLTIFVLNRNVISLPLGSLSAHRNMIFALPSEPEQISEELKKTILGVILMKTLQENENKLEESDILRLRTQNQRKIMENIGGLDMLSDYIEANKEIDKDVRPIQNITGEKKEDK